jgi:hypothetical protein
VKYTLNSTIKNKFGLLLGLGLLASSMTACSFKVTSQTDLVESAMDGLIDKTVEDMKQYPNANANFIEAMSKVQDPRGMLASMTEDYCAALSRDELKQIKKAIMDDPLPTVSAVHFMNSLEYCPNQKDKIEITDLTDESVEVTIK